MTAGATYIPIATTTLGSAAASYTFSSIPSTYTDLVLIFNGTTTNGIALQLNGDTGANYSRTILYGDGSSALSTRGSSENYAFQTPPNPSGGNSLAMIYQINSYSTTTTYKTILSRFNYPSGGVSAVVNLWRSTAAITSISVLSNIGGSGTFSTGSTFTLYGISAA